MILIWQLDGAGWLISIISFMILILAARWRISKHLGRKSACLAQYTKRGKRWHSEHIKLDKKSLFSSLRVTQKQNGKNSFKKGRLKSILKKPEELGKLVIGKHFRILQDCM